MSNRMRLRGAVMFFMRDSFVCRLGKPCNRVS